MERSGIVVREDGRDMVSEAFRILRTNLSFMSVDNPIQVIMLTSSIPHSGKTFVSSNLALTLATSGKRVLVIDFDLRRRTFSKQMGHRNDRRGLTSYLTNKISSLDDIITPSEIDSNLDFIFSGPQPPNPAEMLMSQRVDQFMSELRARYDFVILDSVPAMAVADAMIIDRLVDLTIYVIRQGNLDRRHLPEIENLHREKKFHNMCTILNGVTHHKRRYGYGYGYYDESYDQGRWSKIRSIFNRKHNGEE
jgi:capsular exopolysaccharide synthesis family protein